MLAGMGNVFHRLKTGVLARLPVLAAALLLLVGPAIFSRCTCAKDICFKNSDCSTGRICNSGLCASPCTTAEHCAADEVCTNKICVPTVPEELYGNWQLSSAVVDRQAQPVVYGLLILGSDSNFGFFSAGDGDYIRNGNVSGRLTRADTTLGFIQDASSGDYDLTSLFNINYAYDFPDADSLRLTATVLESDILIAPPVVEEPAAETPDESGNEEIVAEVADETVNERLDEPLDEADGGTEDAFAESPVDETVENEALPEEMAAEETVVDTTPVNPPLLYVELIFSRNVTVTIETTSEEPADSDGGTESD